MEGILGSGESGGKEKDIEELQEIKKSRELLTDLPRNRGS